MNQWEKLKKHEGKNTLMIYSYVLDKVLDKIKETVAIEKFDDFKTLINTIEKCCDINDVHNYPQKKHCLLNKHSAKHFKKIGERLMPVVWHPTKWLNWCLSEDKTKGIIPIFSDKLGK